MANVRLPAELWREVFLHAVHVPGLLTTQWNYHPDDELWRGWEFVEDISIHTKRMIVQVCQEWRALGIEFLYEVIQIPQYQDPENYLQLEGLVDTLRSSSMATDQNPNGLDSAAAEVTGPSLGNGWWVKRIDCPFEILQERNFTHLTSLLHLFYNLSIFTIRQGETSQTRITPLLDLLEARFTHSLRRLDFKVHDPDLPHVALPFIPVFSLDMSFASSKILFHSTSPSLVTITSLTFFLPYDLTDYHQSLYFPNLRHLGLMHLRDPDFHTLKHFVSFHSSTLRSLYLQTMSDCEQIPFLLALATNIHTLTIDDVDFMNLNHDAVYHDTPPPSSFPGITHMGIVPLNETLSNGFPESVKLLINSGMFPDLRLLRLFNQSDSVSLGNGWADVIAKCANLGLRLQGSLGQALDIEER